MKEIKCPHCGQIIALDDKEYIDVVNQITNKEFEARVNKRTDEIKEVILSDAEKKYNSDINEYKLKLARLESELKNMKNNTHNELLLHTASKDKEIDRLNSIIKSNETNQKLLVANAVKDKDTEIATLINKMLKIESDYKEKLNKEKIAHEFDIKKLTEDIEKEKDFKLRLSTKMIGESLEQFCSNEFNKIRATSFPFAYFEKDNDAKEHTKGDFIYRDYTDGSKQLEYISAMLEMKNEDKNSKSNDKKQKNKEFFDKLHKDRINKKCEYAILVSTLEEDNPLYDGIFQVYQYPKMYVVRPNFFLPLLSILKTAAQKNIANLSLIEQYKQDNADIEKFSEHWSTWKDGFKSNMERSNKKLEEAIKSINDTITKLEKTRDALVSSQKQLKHADNKVEDLTLKQLVKDSPSLKKQIELKHK